MEADSPQPTQGSTQLTATPSLSPEAQASRDRSFSLPVPQKLEGMDENTPEGAKKAAQYFLLLYVYTFASGNTNEWLAMSDPECAFCNTVVANTVSVYSYGGWIEPWEFQFHSFSYQPPADGDSLSVVGVSLTQKGSLRYREDGSTVPAKADTYLNISLHMRYEGDGWKVYEARPLDG